MAKKTKTNRRLTEELLGGNDHAVFTPLFLLWGHSFGYAVGEGEKNIAGAHGDGGLCVLSIGKKADHHSRGFERDGLGAAEDVGRVVTGIDEGEEMSNGVVLGVKEGGVAIGGRRFVDEVVDVTDETGEVALL